VSASRSLSSAQLFDDDDDFVLNLFMNFNEQDKRLIAVLLQGARGARRADEDEERGRRQANTNRIRAERISSVRMALIRLFPSGDRLTDLQDKQRDKLNKVFVRAKDGKSRGKVFVLF
jgi:hypothetical protein